MVRTTKVKLLRRLVESALHCYTTQLDHFRFSFDGPTLQQHSSTKQDKKMTPSRQVEIDTARFRKELLFVCCKSDDPTTDHVRQLHDVLPSPTDKMMSPVTRALRARSFQGNNRMSTA